VCLSIYIDTYIIRDRSINTCIVYQKKKAVLSSKLPGKTALNPKPTLNPLSRLLTSLITTLISLQTFANVTCFCFSLFFLCQKNDHKKLFLLVRNIDLCFLDF
jgi:hypothetical protein